MSQYASPYNGIGNNPVNLIDRWGMCAGGIEGGGGSVYSGSYWLGEQAVYNTGSSYGFVTNSEYQDLAWGAWSSGYTQKYGSQEAAFDAMHWEQKNTENASKSSVTIEYYYYVGQGSWVDDKSAVKIDPNGNVRVYDVDYATFYSSSSEKDEIATSDALFVAPLNLMPCNESAPDLTNAFGTVITIAETAKPNNITPYIGWGLTGLEAYQNIRNKNYIEAMWNVIDGAGGIYSVGIKGLYQFSQTEYMLTGVGKAAYQEYMYNVRMYQMTGKQFFLDRASRSESVMRTSYYNLMKKD